MKKVHFMGIGGSGMSGVAMIAKSQGYDISGCDINVNTPYINELKKAGIEIFEGQNKTHVEGIDIVATTPAVFYQNATHPEVLLAKKEKKLMTWQKFLGEYLQKGKDVICVAGTHGKSTTTALLALLFQNAHLDPSVMVGANIKEWGGNFKIGKSKIFITEADEFFDNFLNYKPSVIILNNIEFDHPDYFKNEIQVFQSFKKFIGRLRQRKILIYNEDDLGIKKLFEIIGKETLSKINLYGYSTKGKNIKLGKDKTEFEIDSENFALKVPGTYNVSNALGVITLSNIYKIPIDIVKKTLESFDGIGRRLELIGESNGTRIYDDYAHHPTAIKKTLEGIRQKYPDGKILVVVEPHTFSRTKALLPLYKDAFNDADEVVIAPIFKSRDKEDFGISGNDIVKVSTHKDIRYIDSFDKIVEFVKGKTKILDIIIVMGAGESYKLAKDILNSLK